MNIELTAEEIHCLVCAMAGNFPVRFAPVRMELLRKLARAHRATMEDELVHAECADKQEPPK